MFGKLGLSKGLAQGRRLQLALAPVVPSNNLIFYVDAVNGNDANSGSSGSPWKTLDKVSVFVNNTALPGTEIRLIGDFGDAAISIDGFRGTVSAPLRITTTSSAKLRGTSLVNTSYVKVSLLEYAGAGVAVPSAPAFSLVNQDGAPDCEGVEISHCSIHDFGSAAITFGAYDSVNEFTTGRIVAFKADTNVIARCHGGDPFEGDYATAAIEGWGNYGLKLAPNASLYQCQITNNIISDCPGWNPDPVDTSLNTGSAIKLGSSEECLIQWNQATNCGSEDARRGVGMWFWDSKNCTLANNSVVGQRTGSNVDGCGFDIDGGCQGCVMEYNFAHDCDGPGAVLWQFNDPDGYILDPVGNVVRFNMLIRNNKRNNTYAFGIGGDMNCVNSADVYNNTIVHAVDGGEGMNLRTKGAATIKNANNIIYLEGVGGYGLRMYPDNGGSFVSGYNLFYLNGADVKFSWDTTVYDTLALYQAAGHDPSSIMGDPAFVNSAGTDATGYQVNATSQASGHGVDLSAFGISDGGKDYFGSDIDPARRSIGAYQSPFDLAASRGPNVMPSTDFLVGWQGYNAWCITTDEPAPDWVAEDTAWSMTVTTGDAFWYTADNAAPLQANSTYRYYVTAKALVAENRTFKLSAYTNASDGSEWEGTSDLFTLTDEYQEYVYEFTTPASLWFSNITVTHNLDPDTPAQMYICGAYLEKIA